MSTVTENRAESDKEADGLLIAFAEDVERGTGSVAEWSGRYPMLARDFARIAVESFLPDPGPEHESLADPAHLQRAGRAALAAFRQSRAPKLVPALQSLTDRNRGILPDTIAKKLGLPVAYVAKLQRRLFVPESLPASLIWRLAEAIERTADEVSAYLAAPPTLARAAAYRSDDAPTVGKQEDFMELLRADASVPLETKAAYRDEA